MQAMPLKKHESCCIEILSPFEEDFLSEADKHAILEGGCHGLCGFQVSTSVDDYGVNEGCDTDSEKSSPCPKGPYDKRARFVSPMPSFVMPNGRRGPDSSQPRFSRCHCATQYTQPRKPIKLAEHPSRRAAFHSTAPTAESRPPKHVSTFPYARTSHATDPSFECDDPATSMLNNYHREPHKVRFAQDLEQDINEPVTMQHTQAKNHEKQNRSTSRHAKHASLTSYSVTTKRVEAYKPAESSKSARSPANNHCSPPKVRFTQDLEQQIDSSVTKHDPQRHREGRQETGKEKKSGGGRELLNCFSSVFRREKSS